MIFWLIIAMMKRRLDLCNAKIHMQQHNGRTYRWTQPVVKLRHSLHVIGSKLGSTAGTSYIACNGEVEGRVEEEEVEERRRRRQQERQQRRRRQQERKQRRREQERRRGRGKSVGGGGEGGRR